MPPPIIITPGLPAGDEGLLAEGYQGSDFALLEGWSPASLPDTRARFRWAVYREVTLQAEQQHVMLWRMLPRAKPAAVTPLLPGSSTGPQRPSGPVD